MTIELQCDQCSQKYRLNDRLAGQTMTCQQCQAEIIVPDSGEDEFFRAEEIYGHAQNHEDLSRNAPTAKKRKKSPAPEEIIWDGSSGPLLKPKKRRRKKNEAHDEISNNKKRRRPRVSTETQAVLIWLGGVASCVVLLLFYGLINPLVPLLGGLAFVFVGSFLVHAHACENDAGLLFRVLPFFSFFYAVTVITEVWRWAALQFGGIILLLGSFVLFLRSDDPGAFVIVEKEDYTLTVSVETRDIPWDEEDPAERHQVLESPDESQLEDVMLSLPWNNPQLACAVVLNGPLRNEVFETMTLEQVVEEGADRRRLRILWERYAENIDETGVQEVDLGDVREAIPIFSRFLDKDPNWSEGINWRVSQGH